MARALATSIPTILFFMFLFCEKILDGSIKNIIFATRVTSNEDE
jgi:hypothetical protein